jgi:hypothetical protein
MERGLKEQTEDVRVHRASAIERLGLESPYLGSSMPQRLASSSESGVVPPVPQLPQFEATSGAVGLVVDHRTLLMMKDPEPQFSQANSLPTITRRRHPALSPETCTPADYSTGTALGRPTRRHRCSSYPRLGPQSPRNLPARGTRRRVPTPWSPTPGVPATRTPEQTRRQVPPTQMPMQMRWQRRIPTGRRARTHHRRDPPTACPDRRPSWSFLLGRPRALPGHRPHGLLPW